MKKWTTAAVLAIAAAAVFTTAAPASAKGADQATITGPRLAAPIVVTGVGEPGSANSLGLLSEGSGLFAAMFGPDGGGPQLTDRQPTPTLGAKYQLAYRVPGGNPQPDTVKQDLYPYADGGPVTYTAAGQASFGGTTRGGWFRAPASFLGVLTVVGIPDLAASASAAPSPSTSPATAARAADAAPESRVERSSSNASGFVVAGVIAAAVVLALTLFALRRRRVPAGRTGVS